MPRSVLVVDDDEGSRDVVADMLTDHGYAVQTASNGQEAMDALAVYEAPQPRVMLLDMRMPVMGGAKVLRALAASGRLAALYVVVISGHAHEAIGLGASRVLTKPITVQALLAAVREGCGEPQPRRERVDRSRAGGPCSTQREEPGCVASSASRSISRSHDRQCPGGAAPSANTTARQGQVASSR